MDRESHKAIQGSSLKGQSDTEVGRHVVRSVNKWPVGQSWVPVWLELVLQTDSWSVRRRSPLSSVRCPLFWGR